MGQLIRDAIKAKQTANLEVLKLTPAVKAKFKPTFKALVEEFLREENPEDDPERFIDQGEAYLLFNHGKAVGFITYKNMKNNYCHICAFSISKANRGKGFGRFFLEWFIKEKAGKRVGLGVNPENTAAKKLYLALGFKVIDSGVEDGMPFELMRL